MLSMMDPCRNFAGISQPIIFFLYFLSLFSLFCLRRSTPMLSIRASKDAPSYGVLSQVGAPTKVESLIESSTLAVVQH